jgi:hypothetical protein
LDNKVKSRPLPSPTHSVHHFEIKEKKKRGREIKRKTEKEKE